MNPNVTNKKAKLVAYDGRSMPVPHTRPPTMTPTRQLKRLVISPPTGPEKGKISKWL